jgi:hypothetical protein
MSGASGQCLSLHFGAPAEPAFATDAGGAAPCAVRLAVRLAVLLLLPVLSLPAQAREIKLATWDLGWFTLRSGSDPALPEHVRPATANDTARLRRYAAALDADVIALQGVDGPDAAALLFPAPAYAIHMTQDDVLQRTGFAVRAGLAFAPEPDATALDPYPGARLRLRSGAAIAVHAGSTVLHLLSVHLKSGCREAPLSASDPACATLRLQAAALRRWIAATQGASAVAGDFSRVMDDADAFGPALGNGLVRATAGRASPCRGGQRFVDHIILGGAAGTWLHPGSLRVLTWPADQPALPAHCAVSVRLDLPD